MKKIAGTYGAMYKVLLLQVHIVQTYTKQLKIKNKLSGADRAVKSHNIKLLGSELYIFVSFLDLSIQFCSGHLL